MADRGTEYHVQKIQLLEEAIALTEQFLSARKTRLEIQAEIEELKAATTTLHLKKQIIKEAMELVRKQNE
uniref:Uncharacterized protein n=1 Tax=Panagrolaimus sp. JU765 TaxID=591449 RepID=A0AC34R5X4_9BILA